MVFLLLLIPAFILVVWLIIQKVFCINLVKKFKKCNVVVDGKKGTGKDLIFQYVIKKRKDFYYSNISYGGNYEIITCKDISVYPNTYINFINNKVEKVDRRFYENKDIYISDGGIFLPSYMDSTLYKQFPSFPIYYALSRHLYNSNVHVNVQNFNRLWKALREQADYFVHVKKTISIPFFLCTKVITYDKYESAIRYLEPVKARLINKYSKAETDIYKAENGEIKSGWVIQRKKSIKYNTRAFENIVLNGERKSQQRSYKH